MAVTQISDVVAPSVMVPYIQQKTAELSPLWRSGIISKDQDMSAAVVLGGDEVKLPFWTDLEGESNVGSDDPDQHSTPDKIGADKDVAVKHFRNKSWSSMNLAGELAGDDPAGVIGASIADYWARDQLGIAIASLTGVFAGNAANNGGDMIVNVATDDAGAISENEKISGPLILQAKQTMGDAAIRLAAIVMHSAIHTALQIQGLISFIPNDQANIGWGTYMGYTVIVDDACPAVAGTNRITYTTYLMGRGALAYGETEPKKALQVEDIPSAGNGAGQEVVHSRRTFIIHPRGVRFTRASVAGTSPTNAELRLAANWTRVYSRKAVRLVAIKTNG
jgi:hypothetical protein